MKSNSAQNWPDLNYADIKDTLDTMHQWLQIVGKIRLRTMPWQNHSWHCALYISPTGYTTGSIPYNGSTFQIDFDFKEHKLLIQCSGKEYASMELRPRTVADFYKELMGHLKSMGIDVTIHERPNEMEPAIPFRENTVNSSYDPEASYALWKAFERVNDVFSEFRSDFIGKSSPVHLFWGGFDLALSRFSGRKAPKHPGGMPNMPLDVMQEAYSQEVASVGFWPGSKDFPTPVFYSYIYPTPEAFGTQDVSPKEAFYDTNMGEYFLKYEDVRNSDNPKEVLSGFLNTTYKAAATTGDWDRENLERNVN